jgi:hypothetical protein
MDEHLKNIETLRDNAAQLQTERQNLRFWGGQRKKELNKEEIELLDGNIKTAQHYFKKNFGITPDEAPAQINRIQAKVREKEQEKERKNARITTIRERQDAMELEYHTQKLLNETRPDKEQISNLLEQMRNPSESVREQQLRERVERQLNVVSDYYFERAIEKLSTHQAQILTNIREQAKEREELLKFEREQDFLTRYYQTQDKDERKRVIREETERRNRAYERSR